MIQQIGFKNFRRFENFPMMDLSKVNLLVGTNNSGKSTLVKGAILLLDDLKKMDNFTYYNVYRKVICMRRRTQTNSGIWSSAKRRPA